MTDQRLDPALSIQIRTDSRGPRGLIGNGAGAQARAAGGAAPHTQHGHNGRG